MKLITRSALSASVVAAVVFGVAFARQYAYLSAHQPPHQAGVGMPLVATGMPPSAAWLFASQWAVLAFIATFIAVFVASKLLSSGNHASRHL